ncbi:iron(III) transport system ATP-binding protein [Nocardiopsis sp. Huas11]|uniref:ABC transporter ATP-binding protein n=1 Tax=Nocardiopsis sp. Huas11 TaxID=2183912 RepID=UPI000EB28366|nr:ABC transporter ATP-binding protein [Nocardiopsis sp. Huas11]RKS06528.1 iron(III) transport system ATP-binding protein [Nocardiopsis sp. Huas11]
MSALVVEGVRKRFGTTSVLRGVDLEVSDSSFGALLGPSGCGKTTLLRLVAGFERPDGGTIAVGGRRLADGNGVHVRPERRGIGIVPQEGALFPHLSVARNVAFGLGRRWRERTGARSTRGARTAEVLELVGLSGYGRRMPHELSGGQQQRVALARALAPEPELILLDEPFNALDPTLRADLRAEVRDVLRTAGVTGLLVTHDPGEALSTADHVALMRDGEIVQQGTPRHVYEYPRDAGLAGYLGETVVLPGELRAGRVQCALGTLAHDGEWSAPGNEGPGTVVLRPERVEFAEHTATSRAFAPGAREDGVLARVAEVTFAGHDTVVHLVVDDCGTRVRARSHRRPAPEVGALVRVRVSGEVSFFTGDRARAWDRDPRGAEDAVVSRRR